MLFYRGIDILQVEISLNLKLSGTKNRVHEPRIENAEYFRLSR